SDGPDPRNSRISVCRVADESEVVGDQIGSDAELLANTLHIADLFCLAIDLDDAVATDALREILVRSPDADLLHALVLRGDRCRRGERVVGLELDHRPYDHTHRGERFLQRVELRPERRLDAFACLVAGP